MQNKLRIFSALAFISFVSALSICYSKQTITEFPSNKIIMNDSISTQRKKVALLIGAQTDNATKGCLWDVDNLCSYLDTSTFTKKNILLFKSNSNLCKKNIMNALDSLSKLYRDNDEILFYFSGHGGETVDLNHDEKCLDINDNSDETLLLGNSEFIADDELFSSWKKFRSGVRIVFITDCCNGGSNYYIQADSLTGKMKKTKILYEMSMMSEVQCDSIRCELIHIGATYDKKTAGLGKSGSLFTETLLQTMRGQYKPKTYKELTDKINQHIGRFQRASYSEYGPLGKSVSTQFQNTKPF